MSLHLCVSAKSFNLLNPQCTTECQAIFQMQQNPPSDFSTTCTPTFASAVQSCLNCISTSVPALLLTEDVKQSISNTLSIYQKNCLTLASTTEPVTLPTALSVRSLIPLAKSAQGLLACHRVVLLTPVSFGRQRVLSLVAARPSLLAVAPHPPPWQAQLPAQPLT